MFKSSESGKQIIKKARSIIIFSPQAELKNAE